MFILIESRVEHPLLPFRVFLNRTRAASFVAMLLAPAAMFAMFFFLSQFIQNVMGYSPLKAGFAFLPFSLRHRGRRPASRPTWSTGSTPRYIAGTGTLMAAGGAVRLLAARPTTPTFRRRRRSTGRTTVTDILPFILLMALGMGMMFVPLTLTAVHHLRAEDSGIGSGVLNTMQQVGGALGLATLGTVATQRFTDRGDEFAKAGAAAAQSGGPAAEPGADGQHAGDRAAPGLHRGRDRRVPRRRGS